MSTLRDVIFGKPEDLEAEADYMLERLTEVLGFLKRERKYTRSEIRRKLQEVIDWLNH